MGSSPHVISSLGHYLSKEAGLQPGQSMAYLVAPPIETTIALDKALKAADVVAAKIFPPPTETNYACAFLSGELDHVEAAAEAFAEAPGGFYDKKLSRKLVELLFAVGNSVDPADAYRKFRGRDARIDALMRDRGFPTS